MIAEEESDMDAKRRKTDSDARDGVPWEDDAGSSLPTSPGSDDQHFLDDLALEMERELNDDEA